MSVQGRPSCAHKIPSCPGRYTSNSTRNSIDNGGDVNECYDVPPRAIPVISSPASSPSPAPSCYDIPRPPTSCTPNSNCSGITPLDCYDVPRPLQPLTPSSSASSLTNDGSLSGSNRYDLYFRDEPALFRIRIHLADGGRGLLGIIAGI